MVHCLYFVNCNKSSGSYNYTNRQQKFECKWIRTATASIKNSIQNESRSLSCKLNTLNSLRDSMKNLSTSYINNSNEKVGYLKLQCNNEIFIESFLDSENSSAEIVNTNFDDDLDKNGFSAFSKHLKELTIKYCKIKYVPSKVFKSLRNLRVLDIQSRNSDWSTANLEFHSDSFKGLNELSELNLADNNIWALPANLFCPLHSLKQLNLSRNNINDVSQTGFSAAALSSNNNLNDYGVHENPRSKKSCNAGLEVLDLSHNNVINIPNNCFSALSSLVLLHLDSNELTILDDNSLIGLNKLQFLNMSNNRLIALPPELFDSTKELRQLYFGNNSLAVLAPGLFENLKQLEVLDLSYNELTSAWINRDTFVGLIRLIILKLNNNKISKIDQFVFRELYNLQSLNLEHNNIEVIAQNAFTDLKNLHELLLSNNQIKVIESKNFADLFVLNQLILESNQIKSIHPNAFDNLTNLNDLSLNDNQLDTIPSSIKKLRYLKSLDLGKNKISVIDNDSFEGLEELLGLRLTDNHITTVTKNAFAPLKDLHVLNLASNKIKHIDQSAFISNPTLRAIRLDNNLLEDISSVFTSLPSLVLLNVSDNNIKWFDYSHLPQSLEWLDIHKNNITELGNYFDVTNELKINWLDVSRNKIKVINNGLIPKNIETINLNNNMIDEIPSGTFLNKRDIRKISLSGNLIKKLQITSLLLSKINNDRELPEIYLADNPFHCDCSMEWLKNINELAEQRRQHPKLVDMKKIKCTLEHYHGQNSIDDIIIKSIDEMSSYDFLCKYKSHCFTLCECCKEGDNMNDEFDDDCKCRMSCPDQCSCYHDNTWNRNIVDCGDANLDYLPPSIPIDVTTLYLDGNNISNLSQQHFAGKNRLEVLYLNNSNIRNIASNSFNDLKNLRALYLNNNQIGKIYGQEFKNQMLLNELYLNHNEITNVADNTFIHMKYLKTIDLSNNRLIDFNPIKQLATSSNSGVLSSVLLDGDNKWNCDCKSLLQLTEWIKYRTNDFNVNRMLCMDNRIVGDVLSKCQLLVNYNFKSNNDNDILKATPSTINSLQQPHQNILYDDNFNRSFSNGGGYIPLFAAILVTAMTCGLLIALICIFRQDVKLWAFSRYGIRLFEKDTKKTSKQSAAHRYPNDDDFFNEKVYDAYFIYSLNDGEMLTKVLFAEMQNIGYTISLYNHQNRPIASHDNYQMTNYMIDTLKSASDVSHKIVITVSMNFLQNEWCDTNFRCALQALIDSVDRNNIIMILTVPVQLIQMDATIQLLLRTCTVVCWGEKRFWSKLRYALPDVSPKNNFSNSLKFVDSNVNNALINLRYTAAPTSTLQSTTNSITQNTYSNNSWYNIQPVVCSGYSLPVNQYRENDTFTQRYPAQPYDYSQPNLNEMRSNLSVGGSSNYLGHVYSTIPETPPLSVSSTSSTPTLPNTSSTQQNGLNSECDKNNFNSNFV